MTATTEWGVIQGRPITFPMKVTSFNAVTMGFDVPADAARSLLPGTAFELVEFEGVAQFILNVCDYRENPWGDYNEVNLGFLARPLGAPADVIGSFVYRMPVDQPFTCEAGNRVMGFPKTVERIDVEYADDSVAIELWFQGERAFTLRFPRLAGSDAPVRMENVSYSYLDGVPYGTPLEIDLATGALAPEEVSIELGSGVVADELRTLGLPRTPSYCTWGEGLSATFQYGAPILPTD
jgi:hypothetical protein